MPTMFKKTFNRNPSKTSYKRRTTRYKKTTKYPTKRKFRKQKVNSIRNVFEATNLQDNYTPVLAGKIDNLTTGLVMGDVPQFGQQLSVLVTQNANLINFQDNFRNGRVVSLKITLTPEKWIGITADSSAIAGAKKPKIHWINDDSSTFNFTTTNTLTIQQAKSMGKVYHECEFTRKMVFMIKLYQKTSNLDTDKYFSASQWRNTPNASQDIYTRAIPDNNFYYGFSDLPEDFTMKTSYEVVCDYKNPVNRDIFQSFTQLRNEVSDDEVVSELPQLEKDVENENVFSLG